MRVKLITRKSQNKLILYFLVGLLLISTLTSVYSFSQPATITNQINGNTVQINTSYDYKASITPNILYPDGGTVDVGKTIYKKITTAIPFHLKSTVHTEEPIVAEGTYEIQLIIKAGDIWERKFPLEQKHNFKQEGTNLSFVDNNYVIDLQSIQSFITRVEDETGIHSDQYTFEVNPNIEGTIHYNGQERPIQIQNPLTFQYSIGEINLIGEKNFISTSPFKTVDHTVQNVFQVGGFVLPLNEVRIGSMLFSLLLLFMIGFSYKNLLPSFTKRRGSPLDIINKKYRSRIIPVSQKINLSQKSVFTLDSFKSIVKIADEKELPIFFYKDQLDGSGIFFLVDGDYLYNYEIKNTAILMAAESGSGKVYAHR